jgi:tRNA A37 threonylcarbamoyladenosine biosynthesis protein TsaE
VYGPDDLSNGAVRLAGADDLHEVGWPDAVARARWVFVEWPERIAAALPADRLDVTIAIDAPAARTFTVTGHGPAHEAVIDHLLGPSVP